MTEKSLHIESFRMLNVVLCVSGEAVTVSSSYYFKLQVSSILSTLAGVPIIFHAEVWALALEAR